MSILICYFEPLFGLRYPNIKKKKRKKERKDKKKRRKNSMYFYVFVWQLGKQQNK